MTETSGTLFVEAGAWLIRAGLLASPLLALPLLLLILPRPLGAFSARLSAALDRLSGAALTLSLWAAAGLVILQMAVVILRYVFGVAVTGLSEGVIYLFAIIFMIGSASALRDDAHVRVDILREKMGPRGRALIDLIGTYLFLFPFAILVIYAMRPSLSRAWETFEQSREATGLPLYFLFKTLVPVFALLLILQGLSQAVKAVRTLRAGG